MKKWILYIGLVALYLPGIVATGWSASFDMSPRLMTRQPVIATMLVLYWLVLASGAALIALAYFGK